MLRSLGPIWRPPAILGHGVPFRYPSGTDTGSGLKDVDKSLARECNQLNIMLDRGHLNGAGFWDVAKLFDAPLVATHSNVRAICASSRNRTDRQLRAIAKSGVAGLNLGTCFLRPVGRESANMTLDPVRRHIEHMLKRAGEDHVAIGPDFDGATPPRPMDGIMGTPIMIDAMREMGLGEALIAKIAHGNWLRLLERTWGA